MPNIREKLIELLRSGIRKLEDQCGARTWGDMADHLIANGVTVKEYCHKAESVISKTGLMCTACHSDIDRDAMFCKYCGAKVLPQPPKGE